VSYIIQREKNDFTDYWNNHEKRWKILRDDATLFASVRRANEVREPLRNQAYSITVRPYIAPPQAQAS
jgi:hypothetical protein